MKKIIFFVLILVVNVSFRQIKTIKKKSSQAKKAITVKESSEVIPKKEIVLDDNTAVAVDGGENISVTDNGDDKNIIYSSAGIEQKPEFQGGQEEFQKFIASNYKTPTDPDFIKAKIIVSFIVEKDGSLTDIKVLRDTGFGSGKEAIRVLKLSPKWISGMQNGKNVRCSFQLPISVDAKSGK